METPEQALSIASPYEEVIDLRGLQKLMLPIEVFVQRDRLGTMQGPVYGAMLRMMMCSLREVPAGSLKADERELRTLAGMLYSPDGEWQIVYQYLRMNWVLCDDGRYYDPALENAVTAMWRQLKGGRAGAMRSVEARMGKRVSNET